MAQKIELKIYKHEYGQNLVNTLLRLGAEGYNRIVWDAAFPVVNTNNGFDEGDLEEEEEVTLLAKGEIKLTDSDLEEILKGWERYGETWDIQLESGETATIIGPEPEVTWDPNE